ncbi:MAG: DUF3089 domain-containing protein [Eubacterium sp.]
MKTTNTPYLSTPFVNYSETDNWLRLPKALKKVDIFYLYPTAYYKTQKGPLICETTHRGMRLRAQEHLFTKGSVFDTIGNIYAPYYRQASLECLMDNSPKSKMLFKDGPIQSILSAFDYYIKHYNNGRPFILAGHSQGSMLLLYILSTYFKKFPQVQKQMIAAYVIGYAVTQNFLMDNSHLHFATSKNDIGVIISYNTETPHYHGHNLTLLPNAIAINPISFTLSDTPAPASKSLGARLTLRDTNGILIGLKDMPHYADATLNLRRGTVMCSTVSSLDFKIPNLESVFPKGVLHTADYQLYYYDLRHNAQERVNAFFAQKNLLL